MASDPERAARRGFNLPSASVVGKRLDDLELLREFRRTNDLMAVSEKFGLGGARKAAQAISRAVDRLDRRLIGHAGALRAMEFIRLEELSEELGPAGGETDDGHRWADPKVAAEQRLLSESRRRLYGLDLKAEVEHEAPTFNVIFAPPGERGEGAGGADVIDGEAEELPGLPAPPDDG
jgi:hypothetical protein